jgi:hypothetical protein
MTSRLITPPDKLISNDSYFIINAVDSDVEKLVMHLRTSSQVYDLHLYHSGMKEHLEWAKELARICKTIIINENFTPIIDDDLGDILDLRLKDIVYYGYTSDYNELVDYFIDLEK